MRTRDHPGGAPQAVPPEWCGHRLPVLIKLAMGGCAVMALGGAAVGAWALWTGDWMVLGAAWAFAAYLGHMVVTGTRMWWIRRRIGPPPSLTSSPGGGTGVRFGYAARMYYLCLAFVVPPGVLLGVVAVGLCPIAASGDAVAAVLAILCATGALLFAWTVGTILWLAPGGLVLTPDGIHHRGLTATLYIPWYAVSRIGAGWSGAPGTPVIAIHAGGSSGIRRHRYMGWLSSGETEEPMPVVAGWLAADAVTVYHAVSFYHAHPELRGELATPEAVRRIWRGGAIVRMP